MGTLSNGTGMQSCTETQRGSLEAGERWGGPERHVWVGKFIRTLEREVKGSWVSGRCLGTGVGIEGQGGVRQELCRRRKVSRRGIKSGDGGGLGAEMDAR